MQINEILDLLPHRYPFLLIDKVIAFTPNESLTALKNVTINEPFFTGHFPAQPIMPGVLIVESMAQATAMLAFKTMQTMTDSKETGVFYLAGVDRVRFKKPVFPGDQLIIDVKLGRSKKNIWKTTAEVHVDGKLVCAAELISAYMEKP
ncbi:MAG: 3-hydroxyacyl-[acyl-carrier-protein] dehydratase FabZ [Thiotrichales bacterium]|nr:MAG: 3-hydroxyacyl-[acyl-carrier-protein] dehydratase FabZ [Thiotrichales bacterium]